MRSMHRGNVLRCQPQLHAHSGDIQELVASTPQNLVGAARSSEWSLRHSYNWDNRTQGSAEMLPKTRSVILSQPHVPIDNDCFCGSYGATRGRCSRSPADLWLHDIVPHARRTSQNCCTDAAINHHIPGLVPSTLNL